MKNITIYPNEKVLIIAPHPDDESIGCGGLLLKYSSQCDVLCLTDGRQGQGTANPCELAWIRKNEFNSAMSFLNPHDYKMMGISDNTLCAHLEALTCINLHSYNKVFVTGSEDRHPDHTAALTALKIACVKQDVNPEIYVYEVHRKLLKVTHVLPIDDVIEKKKELMLFYGSQMTNQPFDNMVIAINRDRGKEYGYCEGFCRMELGEIPEEIPLETEISKMREYYWVYTRWMRSLQAGNGIAGILKKQGYQNVMIYGFKELGRILLKELATAGIGVQLIIDRQKIAFDSEINIVNMEDIPDNMKDLPVVVTATWYLDDIRRDLSKLGIKNIISIKDLLEKD